MKILQNHFSNFNLVKNKVKLFKQTLHIKTKL